MILQNLFSSPPAFPTAVHAYVTGIQAPAWYRVLLGEAPARDVEQFKYDGTDLFTGQWPHYPVHQPLAACDEFRFCSFTMHISHWHCAALRLGRRSDHISMGKLATICELQEQPNESTDVAT